MSIPAIGLERHLGPDDLLQLQMLPVLSPARKIQRLDELLDRQRQGLAALGDLRRQAIAELVADAGSVPAAAEALGITRQAVYKAIR